MAIKGKSPSGLAAPDGVAAESGSQKVEVVGVNHYYETKESSVHALNNVDLTVEPGEFLCIVGASGCGKTTLLQMVAGFLQPSEGTVSIGGKPIKGPDRSRGVVFQSPTMFPWLNVFQNVAYGPRMAGEHKKSYTERVDYYIDLMGLSDFRQRAPYELSGGMQQRAAIARVLANNPDVILMDEPFGALDAMTRERLQEELLRLWRSTHKSILFITHSVEEAVFLGTRVIVMSPRPGEIILSRKTALDIAGEDGQPSLHVARGNAEFNAIQQEIDDYIHNLR